MRNKFFIFDKDDTIITTNFNGEQQMTMSNKEVLGWAKAEGILYAVSRSSEVEKHLRDFQIQHLFKSICYVKLGRNVYANFKADFVTNVLKLNPEDCIVFDDDEWEVVYYTAKGFKCLLVEDADLETAWNQYKAGKYYQPTKENNYYHYHWLMIRNGSLPFDPK